MKSLLTLITLLPFLIYSQTRVDISKVNQSGNLFDVVATSHDQPSGYEIYLIRNVPEAAIEVLESGDTVFSVGIYDKFYIADTSDTQIWNVLASNYVTHSYFDFNVTVTAPTTPISYDGIVEVTFTNPGFLGVDEIYVAFNGAITGDFPTSLVLTTEDSIVFRAVGFGPGSVMVTGSIFDNPEFLFSEQFGYKFHSGAIDFELCNNQLQLNTVGVDPTNGCNGYYHVTPLNAEGPISYVWNHIELSGPNADNLCQGNYSVMAIDSVGKCGNSSSFLLDPMASYVLNDPNFGEGEQDTVVMYLIDCNFDYSSPIDSIVYVETTIDTVDMGNGNTTFFVHFDLTVYNDGTQIFWQTAYPTSNPQNTLLSLYFACVQGEVVYCTGITVNNQLALLLNQRTNDVVESCGSYVWQDGITYTSSTNFPWMLYEAVDGTDSMVVLNLTVNPLPEVGLADLGNGTLEATGGDEYQWLDCQLNIPISGAISPTFQPSQNGVYSVIAINSTTNCFDTSDCITIDYLNLSEQGMNTFSVYPNPTKNEVLVKTDLEGAALTVYDVIGHKIFEGTISNGSLISMEDLGAGTYVFIFEHLAVREIQRVIKE